MSEKDDRTTIEEMLEFLDANTETFTFLSQVFFKELTEEAIETLAAEAWPEHTGNAALDRGYNLLRRYFKFSAGDRRSQLAVEYARIFLAAGVYTQEKRSAVPYESVFTSIEHVVMGNSRDDVINWFIQDGFKVNPDLHEPEDHISFELEYLAHMNAKAAALVRAGNNMDAIKNVKRQRKFIEKHLLNWVGQLHDVAQDYAKTTFYTGMLLVCQGALEQASEALTTVSEELPLLAA